MSSDGPETLPASSPVPVTATPASAALVTPAAPAVSAAAEHSVATNPLHAEVDETVRVPVLLFFASAISWLLLGSALATLASIKMNFPSLLTEFSWLTFGRLLPAAANSLTYGWSASAGIGAGLWLLARLGGKPLRHGGILLAAWALWNAGLTLGVFGILYGQGTSYEGLEFPRYASPLIFTAFVFIAIWAVLMYRYRATESTYISQRYVLAAFLWFPWSYATANLILFFLPTQAAEQAIIGSWYLQCLLGGFFAPLALAIAYYVIPIVTGRHIHRYGLANFGFWFWLLLVGWTGAYDLIGGPIPTWLQTVAVVATLLSVVPAGAICMNLMGTMKGHPAPLLHSPSYRFVAVSVPCFLAAAILTAIAGFRGVNEIAHFTLLTAAGGYLVMYGFVGLALYGAVYHIVPRLLGFEWESPSLIRAHFWFGIVGLGLMFVSSAIGGLIQGFGLDDAKVPMIGILSLLKPFLFAQLVGGILMTIGNICLTASFSLILVRVIWASRLTREAIALVPWPSAKNPSTHTPAAPVAAPVP